MRLLEFGKEASLSSVIEALKSVPEEEITLRLPEDTPWLANPVNEKILKKSAQKIGKIVHIEGRVEPEVAPMAVPEVAEEKLSPVAAAPSQEEPVVDEAGFVVGGDVMDREELAAEDKPIAKEVAAASAGEPPEFKVVGASSYPSGSKKYLRVLLKRWPFILAAVLGLVLVLGAYVVYALPKATVKIVVEQRPLEREVTLTASTLATKVDIEAKKIPAITKVSTQSGTAKTAATGTKTVGTSAKGTVTMYNNTDLDKTFAAGQKITAKSATGTATTLKFSLDVTVTVPKRTLKTNPPDPFNLYDPGNRDVTVTAAGIGTDYNLAVNTTFDVDGYDATVFQAKNTTQAMSGGSSRDIQVVAQADLDKLLADLTKELTDKAKSDIKNQAGSDYQISDQAIKVVIASKTYDKKVGDEATEVSLSLALSATAATYSGQDLKELLSKILEQKTPDGYELASEGLQTSAELQNVEGSGDLTFLGRVRANLIPKFDRDELAGNLAGKKPAAAESYLKEIPSVVSYEVDIWPHLPEFFRAFPRDTKRIHIQVTVQ